MPPQTDDQAPSQSVPTPGWQFTPDGAAQPPMNQPTQLPQHEAQPVQQPAETQPMPNLPSASASSEHSVSWSASEFIAHQKTNSWYGLLAAAGAITAVVVYLLTKDIISTVMIVIVVFVLGVFASRKPRTLNYQVDTAGVHIGPKSYPYDDFKSFSVIDEGALSSINLMPLKRFMATISIYYDPQDEDHIVKVLSDYLPFEEGQKDVVDRFMHRIRF
jgi:hypothetical protein